MKTRSNFSALLQAFFTDRLMRQRQVSPETIASYRDAFYLLFRFVRQHLNKAPSVLEMEDFEAPLIVAFLCWLEKERGNCARTRNARLAAIHSFFKYAALHDPVHIALIQRILAIPGKRYDRVPVEYLTRPETEALFGCTRSDHLGRSPRSNTVSAHSPDRPSRLGTCWARLSRHCVRQRIPCPLQRQGSKRTLYAAAQRNYKSASRLAS